MLLSGSPIAELPIAAFGQTVSVVGASAGTSTALAVGVGVFGAVGASDGVATVTGVGASAAASDGAASGTSTVDGVGAATAASDGAAAGTSTVTGIGATRCYAPGSDISVAGWTPSTGVDLFACIDEDIFDDVDYISSPDVSTPATMGWDAPLPAGDWTINLRGLYVGSSGQVRMALLDAGGATVGATGWAAMNTTFTTFPMVATTTGVSTKFRIEVQA
jgi:hypothetical protein